MACYGELAPRILPRPSSAPAGDKLPHYIPLPPTPLDSGLRRNDRWDAGTTSAGAVECGHTGGRVTSSRIGVRDMLSYQSLVPAGAGTSGCEDPESWFSTVNRHGGFCHTHPDPSGGQAPARHYFVDYEMPIGISGRVRTRLDYAGGEFRANNWGMEIEMPIGM